MVETLKMRRAANVNGLYVRLQYEKRNIMLVVWVIIIIIITILNGVTGNDWYTTTIITLSSSHLVAFVCLFVSQSVPRLWCVCVCVCVLPYYY